MKYEAVIFDLYGTIVDILPAEEYERKDAEVAAVLGVPTDVFTPAWFGSRFYRDEGRFGSLELDIDYVCQTIGVQPTQRQISRVAQATLDLYARTLEPREGAVETLSALKTAGIKIGLLSDCALDTPRLWPNTPFVPLFDATVFSCEIGIQKPDPRTYHQICQQLGVTPDKCIYVGDGGSQELSGAQRVGMYPVRIAHTGQSISDPVWPGMEQWDSVAIAQLAGVLPIAGIGA